MVKNETLFFVVFNSLSFKHNQALSIIQDAICKHWNWNWKHYIYFTIKPRTTKTESVVTLDRMTLPIKSQDLLTSRLRDH